MTRRRISIVIPTLNGGRTLGRLLEALAEQEGRFDQQVIAVDSGSQDGTQERLRKVGATVIDVASAAFNHGTTRNVALEHASGDLAVLIVQDAVPASRRWLTALVQPLDEDPFVAGAFARQCPWPDASRLTVHYLSHWVAAQPAARVIGPMTRAMFDRLNPSDRHLACAFDNVCSCIRLSVWRRFPFRATPIAEDLEWALQVLLDGHKLAYASAATVWHSHERSAGYELRRTYRVHQRLQALFGLSTIPTMGSLVRAIATSLPLHVRLAAADRPLRATGMARATALAVALPLGQYLGARSAREGRELLRTSGI